MATTQEVNRAVTGYPRSLKWQDFRSVRTSLVPPFEAQTATRYDRAGWSTLLSQRVYRLSKVSVTVTLNQVGTWVVNQTGVRTDPLLKHEQGHLDITGLIARDMCRSLLELQMDEDVIAYVRGVGPRPQDKLLAANNYLLENVRRVDAEAAALSRRLQGFTENQVVHEGVYDQETGHGTNAVGQQKWNEIFKYAWDYDTSLSVTMMIFS
jgi:hypothetical protein